MRRPDFVHRNFAGLFVHTDLGNLRRIGICGRRSYAAAFVFAATRFRRRRIRTCASQRSMKVDRRHNRFFKCHPILRAFFFALLLQRTSQNLPFDASAHRSARLRNFRILLPDLSSGSAEYFPS